MNSTAMTTGGYVGELLTRSQLQDLRWPAEELGCLDAPPLMPAGSSEFFASTAVATTVLREVRK